MKDYDFFPGEGKFYKANLHCHTVISDGKLTKEQIKEEYQKRGYSIVAFTDHRTYGYHPELTDENFIALSAFQRPLYAALSGSGGFPHLDQERYACGSHQREVFPLNQIRSGLVLRIFSICSRLQNAKRAFRFSSIFGALSSVLWQSVASRSTKSC